MHDLTGCNTGTKVELENMQDATSGEQPNCEVCRHVNPLVVALQELGCTLYHTLQSSVEKKGFDLSFQIDT
jgi:hypothetical protein